MTGADNDQLWAPLTASRGPHWHPRRSHYDALQMSPLPLVRFACRPCVIGWSWQSGTSQALVGDVWAARLSREEASKLQTQNVGSHFIFSFFYGSFNSLSLQVVWKNKEVVKFCHEQTEIAFVKSFVLGPLNWINANAPNISCFLWYWY